MQAIDTLLSTYAGPTVLVGWLTLKGIAGVVNNNVSTKDWPSWLRGSLDWLASADKKAKETSDFNTDNAIEVLQAVNEKAAKGTTTGKVLSIFKLFS